MGPFTGTIFTTNHRRHAIAVQTSSRVLAPGKHPRSSVVPSLGTPISPFTRRRCSRLSPMLSLSRRNRLVPNSRRTDSLLCSCTYLGLTS